MVVTILPSVIFFFCTCDSCERENQCINEERASEGQQNEQMERWPERSRLSAFFSAYHTRYWLLWPIERVS